MKYNFDEIISRDETYSVKFDALPAGCTADALPLWVADMDFPCAQPIIDALHKRIDRQIFGYTLYNTKPLKDSVQSWFKRRYDWDVQQEDIFFSPGVVPALAFLINALTQPNDGIIIQRPVYHPFANKIKSSGRKLVNNSLLYQDGEYTMDYADLEEKLSNPENKGIILCSPHNPVGRVWTEEELRKVVDIAKKYDKWIIADEIHMDLTRKGVVHTPLLKIALDYAEKIISCTAPSKTFNLAGMQISNIVIPNKEWQKMWLDVIDSELSLNSASPFGIEATIAAYNDSEDWLEQVQDYLDENIQFTQDFIAQNLPKAYIPKIEGTYLVWLDLNAYESDPKKLQTLLQKEAHLALNDGFIFGEEGNGFQRINVATPRKNVEECMNRIKKAIDSID